MFRKLGYLLAIIGLMSGLWALQAGSAAALGDHDHYRHARRIVYADGQNGHVISINPDGADRRDYGPGFFPKMSPDGRMIAFSRDTADASARDLYVVNTDGSQLHKVSERVYTPGSSAMLFTWSPDSRKLVFTSESGPSDPHNGGSAYKQIATVRADGSQQTVLTSDDATASNIDPVWSPGGRNILYEHVVYGSPRIYIMNADGSDQHLVVAGATDGSWSPDAKKILFVETGIGVRTADTDGTNRVTLSPIGNNAVWSPDGRRIAMEAPACGCSSDLASIVTINPDGTDKKVIAPPPTAGSVQHPVWSPDSSRVAFIEFASWEPTRLVTVSANGGNAAVVIVESAAYPEWAYLSYHKPCDHKR